MDVRACVHMYIHRQKENYLRENGYIIGDVNAKTLHVSINKNSLKILLDKFGMKVKFIIFKISELFLGDTHLAFSLYIT